MRSPKQHRLVRLLASIGCLAPGLAQPVSHAAPPPQRPSANSTTTASSGRPAGQAAMNEMLVYVGTYTRGASQGIYQYLLDLDSGRLTPAGVVAGLVNPSFLALHPSGRFLYAVSQTANDSGQPVGAAVALAIDPATGALERLNEQPSGGGVPCHLVVDRSGRYLLLVSYATGDAAVVAIDADGRLGKATAVVQHHGSSVHPRQQQPHAHSVNVDPHNRFAMVADLGLDQILVYRFDAEQGTLVANEVPFVAVAPGAGPRHFTFHPNGVYAYVINEINSTVTAFRYDGQRGVLTTLQTVSTLPAGFAGGNTTAEVQVSPSGAFLYGSNRGHDSIVVFAIDPDTGLLAQVEHEPTQGKTPRHFGIDPTGTFLLAANQDSDNIVVFRIDPSTGQLTATGNAVQTPTPVCVKMLPRPVVGAPR